MWIWHPHLLQLYQLGKECLNCGGAHRTFANNCPIRKEAIKTNQEKEEEARPLKAVAQKAAQATIQATTNAWKPRINQVRQDTEDKATPLSPRCT